MNPVNVYSIQPSRIGCVLLSGLTFLSVSAVFLSNAGLLTIGLAGLVCCYGFFIALRYVWLKSPESVVGLELDRVNQEGVVFLRDGQSFLITLVSNAVYAGGVNSLLFQSQAEGIQHQPSLLRVVLFKDSLDVESWRRLRVWLANAQPPEEAGSLSQ